MLFNTTKGQTQSSQRSGTNRFLSVFDAPANQKAESARQKPLGKPDPEELGFFGSLLYALTGDPDSDLTPEQLRARNGRRAEAGQMAAEYKNPGRRWMQPVSGGGGSGLESINKIVSLFGGGGG